MKKIKKAYKLIDKLLEEDRSDFPEPDRNEVDDVPDDNPEKTLKDIEKEVTECFLMFAESIINEDFESAATQIVDNIINESYNRLSEGEQERLKVKFIKTLNSKRK